MPFVFLLFEYLLGVTTHWYNCSGYRAQMLVMWINTSRIIVFVSGAPATVIYEIGSAATHQEHIAPKVDTKNIGNVQPAF